MPTAHERALQMAWERLSENTRVHKAVVAEKRRLRTNPDDFDDVIWQPGHPGNGRDDLAEVLALRVVRSHFDHGRISACRIDLGAMPSSDVDLPWNRLAFDDLCFSSVDGDGPDIALTAEVWNGTSRRSDGQVELLCPAPFTVIAEGGAIEQIQPAGKRFPLEIGSTAASRTLLHLWEERGVARWPYGSTELTLLSFDASLLEPRQNQIVRQGTRGRR